MIGVAILLAGQALALAPPTHWDALPRLSLGPAATAPVQLKEFVQREVQAGRCVLADGAPPLDLAVLVAPNGRVRRIVPRAIGCPSVEQFAAGIVLRAARDSVRPPTSDTWYVTSVALSQP